MKKLITIIAVTLGMLACKPDFDPNDDWEAIDVVYGTLDPDAKKQYFEIGRGYQNREGSALDFAKLNDSIYHSDSMIVELVELNSELKEVKSVVLGRELLTNREEGVFVSPEHYLYTFDSTDYRLKEFTNYEMRVTNSVTGKTSFSQIKSRGFFHFDSATISAGFVNLSLYKAEKVVNDEYTLRNKGNEDVVYRIDLEFSYVTRDEDNNDIALDTLKYTVNSRKESTPYKTDFTLNGQSFINTMLNDIPPLTNSDYSRAAVATIMVVTVYGPEMKDYLETEDNFNAISQTKPFYSNVYDKESGIVQAGLFTSKKQIRQYVSLSATTLKYISSLKPELGFPQ